MGNTIYLNLKRTSNNFFFSLPFRIKMPLYSLNTLNKWNLRQTLPILNKTKNIINSCILLSYRGQTGGKLILFYCIFNIQLMVILGLANDRGSSYLSKLCKLAPIQVEIILKYPMWSPPQRNAELAQSALYINH